MLACAWVVAFAVAAAPGTKPDRGAVTVSLEARAGAVFGITSSAVPSVGLSLGAGFRRGPFLGAMMLGADSPLLLQVGGLLGVRTPPWLYAVRFDFGPFGYSGGARVGLLLGSDPIPGILVGLEARVVRYTALFDGVGFSLSALIAQSWEFPFAT